MLFSCVFSGVVWTENIKCVFRVKSPFSNFSCEVWTRCKSCWVGAVQFVISFITKAAGGLVLSLVSNDAWTGECNALKYGLFCSVLLTLTSYLRINHFLLDFCDLAASQGRANHLVPYFPTC